MDYKDRYNRLLDAIKELQEANPSDEGIQNWINDNVPELKLSEDERIRKEILEFVTVVADSKSNKMEWLAWLEKQGEQKSCWKPTKEQFEALDYAYNSCSDTEIGNYYEGVLDTLIDDLHRLEKQGSPVLSNSSNVGKDVECSADRIVPKFKVGDWVVFANGNVGHITSVGTHGYTFDDGEYLLHENCDKQAHLWSIADAKDGDVLGNCNIICIFRKITEEHFITTHCLYNDGDGFVIINDETIGDFELKPAPKEQYDFFFKKMKEAGYEWDENKKELREIHNALEDCEIENIEHGKYYYCIKDYYAGGNKRASKGDVVQALRGMNMMALGVKANEYFIPVNAIKQEKSWSEEDECYMSECINAIATKDGWSFEEKRKTKHWLKSLKQRLGGEK